jgi:hypothetical protein
MLAALTRCAARPDYGDIGQHEAGPGVMWQQCHVYIWIKLSIG